jgi:hypothetical protein
LRGGCGGCDAMPRRYMFVAASMTVVFVEDDGARRRSSD